MKLLLTFILGAALAWPQIIVLPKKKAAASSYLFEETFDGASACASGYSSNCNKAWTVAGGTPDFDNATSPAPLAGSYSLQLTTATAAVYSDFSGHSGTDPIYFACMIATSGTTANHGRTISLRDSGGTEIGYLRFLWSTDHYNIRLYYNGSGANTDITTTIVNGELWYVKVKYTPGSGNNGQWQVYVVKDNSGFPGWGSAVANITNATDTANVGRLYFGAIATSTVVHYDNIRVSLSDITY